MDQYRAISKQDVTGFISAFLSFISKMINYCLLSIRKYVVFAIVSFLLIAGGGWYYHHMQKPYYKAQMACTFNNLHKKVFGEMVHNLDILAQSRSYTTLASTLNISVPQASTIVGFDALNVAGSPLYEDITSEHVPIYFILKATNRSVFAPVQTSILNYLNNTPEARQATKRDLEKVNYQVEFIQRDISLVDSFLSSYTGFLKTGTLLKDTSLGVNNIMALFSYKGQLEERLTDAFRKRDVTNSVDMLYGFTPPDYPSRGNKHFLVSVIIAALLVSCGLPILYNLLRESIKQKEPA